MASLIGVDLQEHTAAFLLEAVSSLGTTFIAIPYYIADEEVLARIAEVPLHSEVFVVSVPTAIDAPYALQMIDFVVLFEADEIPTDDTENASVCAECKHAHPAEWPHHAMGLEYQATFYKRYGRVPTYRDASSHCPRDVFSLCEDVLKESGLCLDDTPDMVWSLSAHSSR